MILKLGNKSVGDINSVFIVAELTANRLLKFKLAVEKIKTMKEA